MPQGILGNQGTPRKQAKPVPVTLLIALLCILAALSPVAVVSAATKIELTSPVKASFDKTVASADKQMAAKLNLLYADLGSLLKQDKDIEAKIKALHYSNDQAAATLRKQIREIDSDKLSKLAAQVQQTKERYKPLFEAYTAANKQITMAKPLKNKTLNAILRTQADALKLSVQYAREDIKVKEAAYTAAKAAASKAIKSARDSLADADPLKTQIKAQRSAAGLPRSSMSPVWTNFKYAIRKNQAKAALDSLSTLVMLARQIVEQQQKIYALEVKISDNITKTRAHIR